MAIELLVAVLAVWRLSALITYEAWFEWLRQAAHVDFVDADGIPVSLFGKILSCFWCVSLIISIAVSFLLAYELHWVLWPFAISGGAILLNHLTRIVRYVEG